MENQAIKRQKFEFKKSRQVLRIKTQRSLPHKSKLGLTGSTSSLCPTAVKTRKEERKVYVREPAAPFVSMAETIKKFHSGTREMSLLGVRSSCNNDSAPSMTQRKRKLTLTRPNEPDFETSQRVRPVRIKSSAETEEEMMAKIPKFKARPVNKKILEAPILAPPQRNTPCLPEFHEFHLKTMVRANQNADTSSSIVSKESTPQNQQWKPRLTAPISPVLHTSLRARPPKEKLFKAPKFKARPLNKKIFESKGEMGLFWNHPKPQVTIPQEFHFAVDERIPPPAAVFDLFDKLSISAEPGKQILMNTAPNPFHLRTEERGAEKHKKFVTEIVQQLIEEERSRVPKATPIPSTTDYHVIPPKPEPKSCTKPVPFQLGSVLRHEEEVQRKREERQRKEKEEAEMRNFKAQPVLKEDPIPVPQKVRKPLTEIRGFNLQVEKRALERSEFEKKLKEKEMMYKRYRDEVESEKLMEEDKALKRLRRSMVPHARAVLQGYHKAKASETACWKEKGKV